MNRIKRLFESLTQKNIVEKDVETDDPNYYEEDRWYQGFEDDGTLIVVKTINKVDQKHWHVHEPDVFGKSVSFSDKSYFNNEKLIRCKRMTKEQSDGMDAKMKAYYEAEGFRKEQTRKRAEEKLNILLS